MLTAGTLHGGEAPSAWITRWAHLLPAGAVLDLACGRGRHARWLHARGHSLVLVDRDAGALAAIDLPASTDAGGPACEKIVADIESGPWPLAQRAFGGIVVTNYLWRPLFPAILESLQPGGVLLYETFAQGQETLGKPSRPAFLLRPGELLEVCAGLRIVAFEDGFVPESATAAARFVQRIAAVRPLAPGVVDTLSAAEAGAPVRHRLEASGGGG